MHVLLKKLMRYADFHFRINFNKFTSIGTRNELNFISNFDFIQIILLLFDYKLKSHISLSYFHTTAHISTQLVINVKPERQR